MGSGIDCSLDLVRTGGMYRQWTTGKFLFMKVGAKPGNYCERGEGRGGGEVNVT